MENSIIEFQISWHATARSARSSQFSSCSERARSKIVQAYRAGITGPDRSGYNVRWNEGMNDEGD